MCDSVGRELEVDHRCLAVVHYARCVSYQFTTSFFFYIVCTNLFCSFATLFLHPLLQLTKVCLVALVASASAFVPSQNARLTTKLNFEYGEYDEKLWDQVAKKDVYNKWDPSSPRSGKNFNPFETFKGNSPDASGVFPGEVSVLSGCRC